MRFHLLLTGKIYKSFFLNIFIELKNFCKKRMGLCLIQYNTIQYNTIQDNTIQYKHDYYYSGINPVEFRSHSKLTHTSFWQVNIHLMVGRL